MGQRNIFWGHPILTLRSGILPFFGSLMYLLSYELVSSTNIRTDGWMDGWMDGWTDERTDGRSDSLIELRGRIKNLNSNNFYRPTERQTDRLTQTDRQTDTIVIICVPVSICVVRKWRYAISASFCHAVISYHARRRVTFDSNYDDHGKATKRKSKTLDRSQTLNVKV